MLVWSCGDKPPAETPPKTPPKVSAVEVQVAPFDVFPDSANFGIRVRFSEPVVPTGLRHVPPSAFISPPVLGSFRWTSDSELWFVPSNPLPAESRYEINLSSLQLREGTALSKKSVTVQLPPPRLEISTCELVETSSDPISRQMRVSLMMNYSLEGYWRGGSAAHNAIEKRLHDHVKMNRQLGETSEAVPVTLSIKNQSLESDIAGTEMLRPGKDGNFTFRIEPGLLATGGKPFPGAECKVAFKDIEWKSELTQALADSEAKKVPLPAIPVSFLSTISRGTEELHVRFVDPAQRGTSVPHKRPSGEILESGVTISPAVKGQWRIYGESELAFQPTESWIPGASYTVSVDPAQFPELAIASTESRFLAYYLSGGIASLDSGTVPEDPARRVVAATLHFNYPVKAETLEKLFQINISEKGRLGSRAPGQFSVEQGDEPFTAIVRSRPLELKDYPLIVEFSLSGSVMSSLGGSSQFLNLKREFELPSKLDIFSVAGADISVVKSATEELQRVLTITASEDVDESAVARSIELLLLPNCKEKGNEKLCENGDSFYSEAQITAEVEKKAEKLPLTYVTRSEGSGESTFSFSFEADGGRQAFIRIAKGLTSKLGFPLRKPYREVVHLKHYPKRLSIMLDGSLLSLSGAKRLGILAQNVKKIQYRLSRVKATDLHHLVYVSSGKFGHPNLETSFTFDDMAQPYEFREELPEGPSGKPAYTSVDFSKFLSTAKDLPRGLFFLEVKEWLPPGTEAESQSEESEGESSESYEGECGEDGESCGSSESRALDRDSRLVLLTDLGLVVKRALDGSDTVYVASFRKGEPVSGAKVQLISRNGASLFSGISGKKGEVSFPDTSNFEREKQPVIYVAEKDGDLTFISYQRRDRGVNLSRFDIGGVVESDNPDDLRGFMFTDRGIYRPGERASIALTIRNQDFSPLPAALPLSLKIVDPRGETVVKDVIRFPKLGLADYSFETSESRSTGTYHAELIIPARANVPDRILSKLDFRVEEFEPDRLSISATLGAGDTGAFKRLENLAGKVNLKNLFGVPAAGNTIKASIVVDPWSGYFNGYPGYNFRPILEYQSRTHLALDLGEAQTDETGETTFDIGIPDVSGVVLDGIFSAEGFEKESGRSVGISNRALITDLEYLVGVKSEDSLEFVVKGAIRKIHLQAIDLQGQKLAKNLKVIVEREEYRNILVKQPNGVFKYESAKKLLPISDTGVEIGVDGKELELDTQTPGTYLLSVRDEAKVLLNQIRYTVMGEGNESIKINRNANLEIKLDRESYKPGETAELSIKAPYAGFGVITIERASVVSTQWFRMDGTSSVQTLSVPSSIVGNAYITVLLARAWESKEIYLPPLSFASVPLSISENEYLAPPKIEVPKLVRPGEQAIIRYSSEEAGSVILYAVDEGILQFAKYRTPDPLAALLPKRALEVDTRTALDMVMPDFSIVQSVLSPSGDAAADLSKFQNPFKKRNRPPLAIWSGVRALEKGSGEIALSVPDYFDGAVKVFAYFVGEKKVGFSQSRTEVRGDFVLKPNMPTFAAPGDQFDITVEVTNTQNAEHDVQVSLETEGLEIVGEAVQAKKLKPSIGEVAKFRVKAKDKLGETNVGFMATSGSLTRRLNESMSVRPASPLMRTVKFGAYDPEKANDTPDKSVSGLREMYPELRKVEASVSHSPGIFVESLNQFMESYPYGCSEQLTSKGFIWMLLLSYSEDPQLQNVLRGRLDKLFRTLASRMNGSGGIGYWRRADGTDSFVSVYADHLVIDAAEKGFPPPVWMMDSIREYLKESSKENRFELSELFTQAYALYLRARLGEVVTQELTSMLGRLEAVPNVHWKGTALSWLVGSTYSLLRMDEIAKKYIVDSPATNYSQLPFPMSNQTLNAGLISYLKIRHFGGTLTKDVTFSLLNRLEHGAPDSLSAASMALGLLGGNPKPGGPNDLSIKAGELTLPLIGNTIYKTDVPFGTTGLLYSGDKSNFFFYSLVENGFDKKPAKQGSRTQGVFLARDVLDDKGQSVSKLKMGETYRVVLRIESNTDIKDFAIQDLLPAGFEPDLEALKDRRSVGNESNAWACENVDVRDDRLILFGDSNGAQKVFSYPVKPTVRGEFVWPGVYGEAMYDPRVYAWENSSPVTVE